MRMTRRFPVALLPSSQKNAAPGVDVASKTTLSPSQKVNLPNTCIVSGGLGHRTNRIVSEKLEQPLASVTVTRSGSPPERLCFLPVEYWCHFAADHRPLWAWSTTESPSQNGLRPVMETEGTGGRARIEHCTTAEAVEQPAALVTSTCKEYVPTVRRTMRWVVSPVFHWYRAMPLPLAVATIESPSQTCCAERETRTLGRGLTVMVTCAESASVPLETTSRTVNCPGLGKVTVSAESVAVAGLPPLIVHCRVATCPLDTSAKRTVSPAHSDVRDAQIPAVSV